MLKLPVFALAVILQIILLQIPYKVNAEECQATVIAKSIGEFTLFTFSTSRECPDIYGFYLTPTNNDDIVAQSSPQG